MLSEGFILALLTSGAFIGIYGKLPPKMRKWIQDHPLVTEIIGGLFTYWLHGGTLTAVAASAWVGIFLTGALHAAAHPDQYQYLIAAKHFIAEKLGQAAGVMNKAGQSYMASRNKEITA